MSRLDRYEYTDWKNFGARVRKYREQVGMQREKFAEYINRSENFVTGVEKRKKKHKYSYSSSNFTCIKSASGRSAIWRNKSGRYERIFK